MKPDSLAAYDQVLRERLDGIDDETLLAAAATVTAQPLTLDDLRAWSAAGRTWALHALAHIDLGAATRLADDLWRLEEIKHVTWADTEKLERRDHAYEIMQRGFHLWSLEELVDALSVGRMHIDFGIPWEHERRTALFEHPALQSPEQLFKALESSVRVGGWDGNAGWLTWLLCRLIEDPLPSAAGWLQQAWRDRRETLMEPYHAEAVIAAGDPAGIQLIADTLGDARPSHYVMTAQLCLDPNTASSRLGEWLDPYPTEQPTLSQAWSLLGILARGGLRGAELDFKPSRKPLGWVRQDPGWLPLLLASRKNKDPNVSIPAAKALAHADPELLAALLPKPKNKKKIPEATLTELGTAAFSRDQFWGLPIAVSEGAIALFAAAGRIAVHDLKKGLPLRFEVALPDGLALPTDVRDANDDGWDRPGVHGIALNASGDRLAVSGFAKATDFTGVVCFSAAGEVARWSGAEGYANRLHFGPTGNLWVLCQRDAPTVVSLDAKNLAEQGACAFAEFPPPAWIDAFPHPVDDVAVFQAACGQDGLWVKCVERGPKKLKVRSQKLSAVHHDSLLWGYCAEGKVAITLLQSKVLLRQWPDMKPLKGKVTDGEPHEAAGSGDYVVVTVARIGEHPDHFEVYKAPKWDRVAEGKWPKGHALVALRHDVLVTALEGTVHAWKLKV